jgi:hypothetical protein
LDTLLPGQVAGLSNRQATACFIAADSRFAILCVLLFSEAVLPPFKYLNTAQRQTSESVLVTSEAACYGNELFDCNII